MGEGQLVLERQRTDHGDDLRHGQERVLELDAQELPAVEERQPADDDERSSCCSEDVHR